MRQGSFLRKDLTAEYLRQQISYDPETGVFLWRVSRRGRYPGVPVGCIRKSDGYRVIYIDGHLYCAHRLAWLYVTGEWPRGQIDHCDQEPDNNRWSNLRDATPSENGANTRRKRNNKSGFKGVCELKNGRWLAQLSVNRKTVFRQEFSSPEDAHAAYVEAAREHYGEFARAA